MNLRKEILKVELQDLNRKIHDVLMRHRHILETRFNRTGLFRAQHMLLMHLAEHDGVSQKEIAQAFAISGASVGVSLRKMEQAGFVKRRPDPKDNRYYCVEITEKGKKTVEYSRRVFHESIDQMFEGVTPEEQEQMTEIFEKMEKNLIRMEQNLLES